MRILIVTNYFPPEVGAASYLYYDLAETLGEFGHTVTVVTGFPRYRMGDAREHGFMRRDRIGQTEIVRMLSSPFDKGSPLHRGLDHVYLAPSLFAGGLVAERPDVVLAYSPPLTLGATAWGLARRWHIPFVVNVQDLFPQYAIDIGLMKNRASIEGFEALERFIYRRADAVVVNSPGSRLHVLARGGSEDRVHAVSNWVDTDFIRPGPRDNEFCRKTGLADRFVVQYAGTMGYQQDLDTVLEAAKILSDEGEIVFQFVGDGVERERLVGKSTKLGLDNVVFTPFLPRSRFPEVVAAADASVVTLRSDVHTPAIPSKLLTIMAAGRPVLVSADSDGDAPRMVDSVGCGICVQPGRPDLFAAAVRAMSSDRTGTGEMGRRGRQYAERNFSRIVCVRYYEQLFRELILQRRHRTKGS